MVEGIHTESLRTCMGRNSGGNCQTRRGYKICSHRLEIPWDKFRKYEHIILKQNIFVVVRLNLLGVVVSLALFFGLATLRLTKIRLQKLGPKS